MDRTTEQLLAAWRAAEAAVVAAGLDTTEGRLARRRADLAKTAYLTHVNNVFDVEGHGQSKRPDREDRPRR